PAFYRFCGLDLTPEAARAMRDYLQTNKGDRYGKIHYSSDIIGADIDELNREFAAYRERFGLDIEQRSQPVLPA
nr:hypothetical protein [Halioglobus sp.]